MALGTVLSRWLKDFPRKLIFSGKIAFYKIKSSSLNLHAKNLKILLELILTIIYWCAIRIGLEFNIFSGKNSKSWWILTGIWKYKNGQCFINFDYFQIHLVHCLYHYLSFCQVACLYLKRFRSYKDFSDFLIQIFIRFSQENIILSKGIIRKYYFVKRNSEEISFCQKELSGNIILSKGIIRKFHFVKRNCQEILYCQKEFSRNFILSKGIVRKYYFVKKKLSGNFILSKKNFRKYECTCYWSFDYSLWNCYNFTLEIISKIWLGYYIFYWNILSTYIKKEYIILKYIINIYYQEIYCHHIL